MGAERSRCWYAEHRLALSGMLILSFLLGFSLRHLTTAETQARRAAEAFLEHAAHSETELLRRVELEGFSPLEAIKGVVALDANWNFQAARSAQYVLENSRSGWSEQELISILKQEGFSTRQATEGVRSLEVDWNFQADQRASYLLASLSVPMSSIMSALEDRGFSKSQIDFALADIDVSLLEPEGSSGRLFGIPPIPSASIPDGFRAELELEYQR